MSHLRGSLPLIVWLILSCSAIPAESSGWVAVQPGTSVGQQVWPPADAFPPGGGGVLPRVLHEVQPAYTVNALRSGVQGITLLDRDADVCRATHANGKLPPSMRASTAAQAVIGSTISRYKVL